MFQVPLQYVAAATCAMVIATLWALRTPRLRRVTTTLTQRWAGTSQRTAGLTLALLTAIAIASVTAFEQDHTATAPLAPSAQADAALQSLRDYVGEIDAQPAQHAASATEKDEAELPDVATMIGNLAARLEQNPKDVRGWKMLGWSYLNTDRPAEAAKAYETALGLAPDDAEIKKALDRARSATGTAPTPAQP